MWKKAVVVRYEIPGVLYRVPEHGSFIGK